jgi:YYY domain-containing protein
MDQVQRSKSNRNRNIVGVGILLTLILVAGAFLRFRGLIWGEYQYLHPDERFLIWVGTDISPVESFSDYWDTANSSLNPHNRGHGFYVYGTLPLYLARYAVEWVYGHSGFNEMTNAGRFLSASADLLTVLFVYLVGARVYNKRVGLLAAALSGLAVLQIQQSHFFTVDTFTTLFSMMAIYFAVSIAYDEVNFSGEENSLGSTDQYDPTAGQMEENATGQSQLINFFRNPIIFYSLGFGLALGLAASSKVSAAPLALLLPAAFVIRLYKLDSRVQHELAPQALGYLILAGFTSLLVFRIFQPIAFSGPGFFGILPNEAWIGNLQELANQASGDVDFPPALQWARRPVWFAWDNMVRWGMGWPMGILAWAGFLWIGWRMIRGEWQKHILLWGWTALIFVWQSLIFNPSMRYQLLIYPTLAIFAGWVVIRLYDWGKGKSVHRYRQSIEVGNKSFAWARVLAVVLGASVLIGTAIYAFSFTNIYTRPITRVDASRWIYQNIPGPIDVPIQTEDGTFNQKVSYPYNYIIDNDLPYISSFEAQRSGEVNEIFLYRIIDPRTNFGEKNFQVKLSTIPGVRRSTESVIIDYDYSPEGVAGNDVSVGWFENPPELVTGQKYYLQIGLPPGQGPIQLYGELDLEFQGDHLYHWIIPLEGELVDSINTTFIDFIAPGDGFLTEISMKVIPPPGSSEKTISVSVSDQPDHDEELAVGTYAGEFDGVQSGESYRISLNNPLIVEEGRRYFLKASLAGNEGGVILRGAPLANEGAWDDGLPVRLDGYDGFAGIYEPGLNFDMYEDDNPNKLSRFYDILDHTEYLLISSSRQWGSLPRIPERFPMTSEYYRHLLGCPPELSIESCYNVARVGDFQGDLGFELVAVFQSDPGFGTIGVNDQSSEEAFTVYDHPKVLVFQKGSDYDPERVRQILGSVDLTKVIHLTPKRASELPSNMMLPLDRLASQFGGGTWSELFVIESLINRSPIVTTIVWYLVVALLGIIVYPILRFALPGLADRGYPLSRIAGLLFLSYLVWVGGSAKIPFTSPTITLMIIALLLVGGIFFFFQRADLGKEWQEKRNYFLVIEGLFLAFFVFDLLIRLGNPDLWHPWKGGERPMDFSYLNAVLKSTTFPPYDPWFAGGYINYYYYGFVYVGVLVKWLGIVPSVAYNLIIPTLFSMIAMGAFSIGWNLVSFGQTAIRQTKSIFKSLPFFSGIAAAVAVAVIGNLGTLRMIYQGYQRLAAPGGNIEGANIISRIIWAVQGAIMTLTGSSMPYGIADWYWLPSRTIPAPNDVEPITEFPFFTVLYGDPHAHLFALPLTLLALSWGLSIVFARGWSHNPEDTYQNRILLIVTSLLVGGLSIGVLRPTNTWDFPIYLVLGLIAVGYAIFKYFHPERNIKDKSSQLSTTFKWIGIAVGSILALGGLAFLLYQPYANWYVQGYTNIQLWNGSHTPFWSYLTHWGVFLFVIISWLAWETHEWMANTPLSKLRKLTPYRGILIVCGVLIIAWIVVLQLVGVSIAWFVIPLVIWVGLLVFQPNLSDAKRAVLIMIAAGLSLTLMVEIIVLVGDIGRMNTVFKFYLQVWTLLALSAAAGFGWTLSSLKRWSNSWKSFWQIIVILLVSSAALYPLLGSTAKINDRMVTGVPATLDGMAFMEYAQYDDLGKNMDLSQAYHAIRWLQENVKNSPVIIEGNMVEYHWGTRNTIYTGLPNVIGWNWHQRQQRASASEDLIQERITEVNEFYLTTDQERAKSILDRFGVEYIVLGQLEHALYPGIGLDKFEAFDGELWDEVYRNQDTVIYRVKREMHFSGSN